jgi:hypothetical protein
MPSPFAIHPANVAMGDQRAAAALVAADGRKAAPSNQSLSCTFGKYVNEGALAMTRYSIAALVMMSLLPASAMAASSPIESAFGNTIVSTYPDGRTAELWLQPDGGYSAKGRRGDGSSGRWDLKSNNLCLRQSRPLPVLFSFCTTVPQVKFGASWSAKAVTGEPISVRLVKGRRSSAG